MDNCDDFSRVLASHVNWDVNQKTIMNVTSSVVCYKYKALKNGEYPIMLRVCKDAKRNHQRLGISIKLEHWDFKKDEPKLNCPNRDYLQKIISDINLLL